MSQAGTDMNFERIRRELAILGAAQRSLAELIQLLEVWEEQDKQWKEQVRDQRQLLQFVGEERQSGEATHYMLRKLDELRVQLGGKLADRVVELDNRLRQLAVERVTFLRWLIQLFGPEGESLEAEPQPTATRQRAGGQGKHSILELQGLGKEIWEGIEPQEYVEGERAAWGG